MSIRKDLSGKSFANLKVLKIAQDEKYKKKKWLCQCKCGELIIVESNNLISGHTKSCKKCSIKNKSEKSKIHGMTNTKLYGVWNGMINRCENPNTTAYKDYGKKGISVCEEWHNASIFFEWAIKNGYKEGLQIDRINTQGNYCAENCRWVDRIQNANNKTNNKYIEYNGETKTMAEWARYFGVNYKNLSRNLKKGYSLIQAIERDKNKDRTHNVKKEILVFGGEE